MTTTAMPNVLGAPAIDFRLPATEGRTFTLVDVAGKEAPSSSLSATTAPMSKLLSTDLLQTCAC